MPPSALRKLTAVPPPALDEFEVAQVAQDEAEVQDEGEEDEDDEEDGPLSIVDIRGILRPFGEFDFLQGLATITEEDAEGFDHALFWSVAKGGKPGPRLRRELPTTLPIDLDEVEAAIRSVAGHSDSSEYCLKVVATDATLDPKEASATFTFKVPRDEAAPRVATPPTAGPQVGQFAPRGPAAAPPSNDPRDRELANLKAELRRRDEHEAQTRMAQTIAQTVAQSVAQAVAPINQAMLALAEKVANVATAKPASDDMTDFLRKMRVMKEVSGIFNPPAAAAAAETAPTLMEQGLEALERFAPMAERMGLIPAPKDAVEIFQRKLAERGIPLTGLMEAVTADKIPEEGWAMVKHMVSGEAAALEDDSEDEA